MRPPLGFFFLFASLAAVAAESPAASTDALIPLKDFARFSDYSDVQISPTGEFLAAKVFVEGQMALAVVRLADKKMTGALRFRDGESVLDYWWVGPKRLVFEIGEDFGLFAAPAYTGQMGAMDVSGHIDYLVGYREASSLGHGGTNIHLKSAVRGWTYMVDPLPKDSEHALVQVEYWHDNVKGRAFTSGNGYAVVFEMQTQNGKLRRVTEAPFEGSANFLADQSGDVRYVTGRDVNRAWQTYYRGSEDKDWRKIDLQSLHAHYLSPLAFSADDSRVYLKSDEDDGRDCLIEHVLATAERRKLACGERSGRVVFSFDGGHPIATINTVDVPRVNLLDAKDPDTQLYGGLIQSFPGQLVEPVSATVDGAKIIVLVFSDHNPGDYYLVDRATRKAEYLLPRNSWIDPERQAEVRGIKFKSRDGLIIHGYLTLPAGRKPEQLPLVVHPHGGPFGLRDDWRWQAEPQMLASRGYAVLQVNFRGSGGYGEDFIQAGRNGWGTKMIDDINDGARWAIEQGYADAGRVCIYGGSYGGYAALMSAVREPDLYKCAIGYAGAYDLRTLVRDADFAQFKRGFNFFRDWVGASDAELLAQSPVAYLDKLKAAVMIVHGELDRVTPYSQAKQLRAALEQRQLPYEWFTKSTEFHGFYSEKNREELYEKLLAFLDKQIGSKAAATISSAP